MTNFELLADEVVLYEGIVTSKNYKGSLQLTLGAGDPLLGGTKIDGILVVLVCH